MLKRLWQRIDEWANAMASMQMPLTYWVKFPDPWTIEGNVVSDARGRKYRVAYRDGWRYLDPL